MALANLRKLWRDVHLWIGVGLALLLVPLSVTGSWLVFDDQIDHLLHPARYAVAESIAPPPATPAISAYVTAANQGFAGRAQTAQLRWAQAPGALLTATSAQGLTAWIDPATGRVLDVGNPRQELRGSIHQLHGNLFMGQNGRRFIGALGLVMFVSCLTGIYLWWPRNNKVLKALRWRRSPSTLSNLHHMVGIWLVIPLAILCATGAAIAFPEVLRLIAPAAAPPQGQGQGGEQRQGQEPGQGRGQGPGRAQGQQQGPPQGQGGGRGGVAQPLANPHLGVDAAVAAAQAEVEGAKLQQIDFPAAASDRPAWRIQMRGPDGAMQVSVDDATGEARARPQQNAQRGPGGGDPVMRVVRQLHAGDDTSMIWRVLIAITGLAPALLAVTGVWFWIKTLRRA